MRKNIIIIFAVLMLFTACKNNDNENIESVTVSFTAEEPAPEITTEQTEKELHGLGDYTETEVRSTDAPDLRQPADENETEEIKKLLSDFKDFSYSYLECKEIMKHISNSSTKTETKNNFGVVASTIYYEVTDGDVVTPEDMRLKMSELMTDSMINDCMYIYEALYLEEEGKLYLSQNAGFDGGLLGVDAVYINSVSKAENDYYVNMTAWGDKNIWNLEEDFEDDFQVRIKKTDNGFRIDECGVAERSYITWCFVPDYALEYENDMVQ